MAFKSNMLFDVLENILKTKSEKLMQQHICSDNFKDAAPFMIRRYLTMHPSSQVRDVVLSNMLSLEHMPEKAMYKWLLDNIPPQRVTFIRYIR